MNQYADYAYSLDDYYEQNYQPILSFEEQKNKIKNFDENKSLPDTIDFFHIKNKKGFTIKEFIKYEYRCRICLTGSSSPELLMYNENDKPFKIINTIYQSLIG